MLILVEELVEGGELGRAVTVPRLFLRRLGIEVGKGNGVLLGHGGKGRVGRLRIKRYYKGAERPYI
jgi:hypothetical protein